MFGTWEQARQKDAWVMETGSRTSTPRFSQAELEEQLPEYAEGGRRSGFLA